MARLSGVCALVAVLAASACQKPVAEAPSSWTATDVSGATLKLIDDNGTAEYSFNEDGNVSANVGSKGGPTAAPIFHWHIEGDVLVISHMPAMAGAVRYRIVAHDGDALTLETENGTKEHFRYTRQ